MHALPGTSTWGLTWPSLPALASGPCRMGDGERLNCTVGTQSTLIFSRPGWRSRAGATPAGHTRRWLLATWRLLPQLLLAAHTERLRQFHHAVAGMDGSPGGHQSGLLVLVTSTPPLAVATL